MLVQRKEVTVESIIEQLINFQKNIQYFGLN
jgi:hypothetical protein